MKLKEPCRDSTPQKLGLAELEPPECARNKFFVWIWKKRGSKNGQQIQFMESNIKTMKENSRFSVVLHGIKTTEVQW